MSEKILSFEVSKKHPEVIEIFCNKGGLEDLILYLTQLLKSKKEVDHEHLMTESWAGKELTEYRFGKRNTLAHQINIFKVTQLPPHFL
jgi:hypothetical protein